jgi:CHASE3 domain sensor protein
MTPPVWTEKQCNAVLLVSVLLLFLVSTVIYLVWQELMSGYQEVAEDARHRTAHYLRVAERKSSAETELGSSKLTALIKQNYLTAEAPGIAYAELQQQIKEIISAAGGVALSTQLVQETQTEEESAEKIIVRVRMQGDSYSLQKLVLAIEQRKPLLFFDRLTIAAPSKSKPNAAEQLDIRFDVYGYFWNETS